MTTFARMVLQPELSLAEAKKQFEHNYLQHHHYDRLVEDNLLGELREVSSNSNSGKPATIPKFLFLKNALPQKTVLELYPALSRLHFRKRNHSRLSVGLGKGGDTAMGWFEKPYPPVRARVAVREATGFTSQRKAQELLTQRVGEVSRGEWFDRERRPATVEELFEAMRDHYEVNRSAARSLSGGAGPT